MARRWWSRVHDDSGNSLIIVIVYLPMLLATFGMGFDVARNVYVKHTLQGIADQASAAAAFLAAEDSATDTNNWITEETARDTVMMVVRSSCPEWDDLNQFSPACGGAFLTEGVGVSVDEDAVTVAISAETTNFFLRLAGLNSQEYSVESVARLEQPSN